MRFYIHQKVIETFDRPLTAVIIVTGLNNTGEFPGITTLTRQTEEDLRKKLENTNIAEHPNIAPWRETYKKFGSRPSQFRCSAEALARIVSRGVELKKISPLVDLYNYISIKYILPVGAEDLDKMSGDLRLTIADGTEEYTPLGEQENDPPTKGEVIYRDDVGVICRRWNWREGDRTKITEITKNAVVVVESTCGIPIKEATEELNQLIKRLFKAETSVHYLDSSNPSIEISV